MWRVASIVLALNAGRYDGAVRPPAGDGGAISAEVRTELGFGEDEDRRAEALDQLGGVHLLDEQAAAADRQDVGLGSGDGCVKRVAVPRTSVNPLSAPPGMRGRRLAGSGRPSPPTGRIMHRGRAAREPTAGSRWRERNTA